MRSDRGINKYQPRTQCLRAGLCKMQLNFSKEWRESS